MNAEVHQDPFAAPEGVTSSMPEPQELEVAWFDAPARRSSRPFPVGPNAPVSPSQMPPAPPIDDPIADPWFK